MNTNVLQKCVDELKKEQPNIQYVLGMLETVIELSVARPMLPTTYPLSAQNNTSHGTTIEIPQEEIPAHLRVGPIAGGK